MGSAELEAFLTHLAVNEYFAASTQNQALYAVVFRVKFHKRAFCVIAAQLSSRN
ncbi:MAG: hypothetical protein KME05_15770 [Gloeocapsa sp. UFS-A4-WI-NPMV-4B04]|jgi:hypothetical protein|nr:hypothetical protein [Gloeocapsa sp. UFS-A4-WI-NPMV-4B04]